MLLLTPEVRESAKEIVEFSSRPPHWYKPFNTEASAAPGEDARHVLELRDFRCVFSFTCDAHGSLYRHLSISHECSYPSALAAWHLAQLFGFDLPELPATATNEEAQVTLGALIRDQRLLVDINFHEGTLVLGQLLAPAALN